MLNKGKKPEKMLPDTVQGLYEKYIDWGIIKKDEKNGGLHPYLREVSLTTVVTKKPIRRREFMPIFF